eukprot:tig00001467_g8769.t1
MIEERRRRGAVDRGEDVIVGVNKYRKANEDRSNPESTTTPAPRQRNLLDSPSMRARARHAGRNPGDGRRLRRYGTQPTPVKGVYGGAYDDAAGPAQDGVRRRAPGPQARMLVAKMGQDGHDRGANLVSSAFGDLGFEWSGPCSRPRGSAALAIASVSTWSAPPARRRHKTLIPTDRNSDAGRPDIKVSPAG